MVVQPLAQSRLVGHAQEVLPLLLVLVRRFVETAKTSPHTLMNAMTEIPQQTMVALQHVPLNQVGYAQEVIQQP